MSVGRRPEDVEHLRGGREVAAQGVGRQLRVTTPERLEHRIGDLLGGPSAIDEQPIMLRQQILIKFNQPKMAEERLRRLMELNPQEPQLRDLLAQALEAQGKRAEAQNLFLGGAGSGG